MVTPTMEQSKTTAWPKIHGPENVRLREQLGSFCKDTSFTAIVNIYRATSVFKRLAWFLTFLFCLGWLTFQCYQLLDRYFSYPSDVKIEINSVTELDFPSVTVCNMNPVRSSALFSPPFDQMLSYRKDQFSEGNSLYDAAKEMFSEAMGMGPGHDSGSGQIMGSSSDPVNNVNNSTEGHQMMTTTTSSTADFENYISTGFNQWDILDEKSVNGFYNTTDSEFDASFKYAYLSAKVNKSLAISVGHSLKTFMISCKYGGFQCSPQNFTTFHNHKYGNCFTFNHPDKGDSLKAKFPGPLFGLSLELYLEQSEYIPALSPEAGVKVVVHPRNTMPFPVEEGISVSPGYATSIGLNAVEMIRLEPPHADCATKGLIEDIYMKNLKTNYSKLSCMKTCYQMLIMEECNCSNPTLYVENIENVCNMTNNTIAWCAQNIKTTRQADYKACDAKCPQACYEQRYEKSISMAAWPSSSYENQLTRRVESSSSNFRGYSKLDSTEFVKLRVYFQELVFKRIEDKKSYESMNLISDIGGQLGLWLGLSAITIGELCSFLLLVCRVVYRKMLPRRTTPIEKVKLDNVS
ncbi:degenerin-like protein asic-1 [Patella vulgata]|uniref:degenerin-like protein asic-1 n=1 Tax=Patella vulgata TaxID=6465 RepID=UPI00217F762B|nr:degenerin-like protein asic-1 [Patella vulgata]